MSRVSIESFTTAAKNRRLQMEVPCASEIDPAAALALWELFFGDRTPRTKEHIFFRGAGYSAAFIEEHTA
jgi:hypothetical protein